MNPYSSKVSEYLELIQCVPLDTAEFVFAYGSGAISQGNENMKDKMVDFIIITNDPLKFHADNINKNPSHYSFLRKIGPKRITEIQTKFGARVYYNSRVESNNRMIKYGVISTDNVLQDLLDWNWLYVAGRMQKPILNVLKPTKKIEEAMEINHTSALQLALLMVEDTFTFENLFKHIVNISYNGDFRQVIGEDKNKVNKIVHGSYDKFMDIYKPLLEKDPRVTVLSDKCEQDNTTQAVYHRINLLPLGVINCLQEKWKRKNEPRKDVEEISFTLANRTDFDVIIRDMTSSIVAKSSRNQTIKNALSAGFGKSILYTSSKLLKMIRSIR